MTGLSMGLAGTCSRNLRSRSALLLHTAFVCDSPCGRAAWVSYESAGALAAAWRTISQLPSRWAAVWARAGGGLHNVDCCGCSALLSMCVVCAGQAEPSGFAAAVPLISSTGTLRSTTVRKAGIGQKMEEKALIWAQFHGKKPEKEASLFTDSTIV